MLSVREALPTWVDERIIITAAIQAIRTWSEGGGWVVVSIRISLILNCIVGNRFFSMDDLLEGTKLADSNAISLSMSLARSNLFMNTVLYRIVYGLCLLASTWTGCTYAAGPTAHVTIGVLAYQGEERAQQQWQPTIEYLNESFGEYQFELRPLTLQQVEPAVSSKVIDFLITNTGNYVELENKYGVSRIATLVKNTLDQSTTQFGAVLFTRSDNQQIYTLKDISGARLAAVNEQGFGGFQVAWRELNEVGINPYKDLGELIFTGFPQQRVVQAVLEKRADVGTFRTDSLEQLARSGVIDLDKFRIINAKTNREFPFLHSSRLYPEWPFAKLRHTPRSLAHQVAIALLDMKSASPAAKASASSGWTIPLDYQPVHDLMSELQVGPYAAVATISIGEVFKKYAKWIVVYSVLFLLITALCFALLAVNRRLVEANVALEKEVRKRTQLAENLEYQAMHDALTGAYNRLAFSHYMDQSLKSCKRDHGLFAVFVLDVDNFKDINENYGHQIGDQFLKQLVARIQSVIRETDVVARLGGDEFAIILNEFLDDATVSQFTSRLESALDRPYSLDGVELESHVSIGVSIYPDHGEQVDSLLKVADQHLYDEKKTKKVSGL